MVLVSGQFTIYQLTNTIIYDLPRRIQLHKPKVVVVSGLLDQFYDDPYIRTAEAESLISQIVTALHKIKDVFIILTSRLTENQIVIPALSRIEIRAKKEFDETNLNLSIYNNGRLKKISMMEAEYELTKVCELPMYNKFQVLQNTINAVVDLKNSQVRARIFSVIQTKQNGKCHHCKINITLSDTVVSNGNGRGYYHKSSAEKLHIIN